MDMDTIAAATQSSTWDSSTTLPELMNSTSPRINITSPTLTLSTDPRLSSTFMAVYFGFRILWSVLTIFGNVLTIVAVVRSDTLHNNTSYLICSLAVADLIGGSLTPMVIVHHMFSNSAYFIPLCLIEKSLSLLSTSNSVLNIMWIAIDRYVYIAHPLHYPLWVTSTKTFIVIGFTWFLTAAEIGVVVMAGQNLKIGMTCKFAVFLSNFVYNSIIMPQIFLYSLITVGFYTAICRIANKQHKAIASLNHPCNVYETSNSHQQKKVSKMMILVLGTFFACYTPQVVSSFLLKLYKRSVFTLQLEKATVLIYWANTWLNPVIYAWKCKDFRVAFRKLLRLKPSNDVEPFVPIND